MSTPDPRPLVLVAEDHLDSREALRALLEAWGYRVVMAANGREAVEIALSAQPDLVLMDVMMPEMDGFEATRRLRADQAFRQSPVVAITAMEGAQEQALLAGCNDYLPKPIDIRTFMKKIHSWLGTGNSRQSS